MGRMVHVTVANMRYRRFHDTRTLLFELELMQNCQRKSQVTMYQIQTALRSTTSSPGVATY